MEFGNKLERFERGVFTDCTSLERISIPFKDGMITDDDIFLGCVNLKRIDLVQGELHKAIDALLLDEWRDEMNKEIESINQILPDVFEGKFGIPPDTDEVGQKAQVVRSWIRTLLRKIIHYKAEHRRLLYEDVGPTLQHALPLPRDIVMNRVLPFLVLPSYTFEVEDER